MKKIQEWLKAHRNVLFSLIGIIVLSGIVFVFSGKRTHTPSDEVELIIPPATSKESVPTEVKKDTVLSKTKLDTAGKFYQDSNYDEALKEVNASLSADKTNAEAWYMKSRILVKLGDLNQAFTSANNATTYAKTDTTYWKWKIELARMIKEKQGVGVTNVSYRSTIEPLYKDALLATDTDIEIVMPYAIFLEDVGDKVLAIQYWEKAIEINPSAKSSYEANIANLK